MRCTWVLQQLVVAPEGGGNSVYFWVGCAVGTLKPIPDLPYPRLAVFRTIYITIIGFNVIPPVNNVTAIILFTFRKASFSSESGLIFNSSYHWSVSRPMIPHSRPKLSDFYTLSETKLLENHTLHSGTYLYSSYMEVPPSLSPPPPPPPSSGCNHHILSSYTLFKHGKNISYKLRMITSH